MDDKWYSYLYSYSLPCERALNCVRSYNPIRTFLYDLFTTINFRGGASYLHFSKNPTFSYKSHHTNFISLYDPIHMFSYDLFTTILVVELYACFFFSKIIRFHLNHIEQIHTKSSTYKNLYIFS